MISGGIEHNSEYASRLVTVADSVGEEMACVLYDPQTSGGLLMSVPEERTGALVSRLLDRGVGCASIIGRIVSESEGHILVRRRAEGKAVRIACEKEEQTMAEVSSEGRASDAHAECCASGPDVSTIVGTTSAEDRFSDFMREASSPGAIPLRTKELMAVAL